MNKEEIKEILDNLIINETTGMCYLSIRLTNQTRDIITSLQQENERLKQFLFESVNNTNKAIEQIEIYRTRNDKVIEYIDEHTLFVNGGIIKSILIGSDENE